jgi:phosphatidylglycerol lysyltransferase
MAGLRSLRRAGVRFGKPLLTLVTLLVAAWFIRREVAELRPSQVAAAIRATPARAIVASAAFSALSYACLATAEWCIFRYIGRPQDLRTVVPRSLAAHALSSNLGFGLVTGVAVRYRLYGPAGIADKDVIRLSLRVTAAIFASGFVTLGLTFLFQALFSRVHALPSTLIIPVGLVLLCPAALWFLKLRRTGARRRDRADWRIRWLALVVSIGDWLSSGAALFVLSGHAAAGLPAFLTVFLTGSLAGSLAGIPAALGVLDAAVLGSSVLSRGVHETAAALLLYRVIYFLGPLVLAGAGLALSAMVRRLRP